MLKIAKGTTQPTLTEDEFDTVYIEGLDADDTFNIGTNIGG